MKFENEFIASDRLESYLNPKNFSKFQIRLIILTLKLLEKKKMIFLLRRALIVYFWTE